MKKFISEQNTLDKFIYQTCREANPPFMSLPEVRTLCGVLSKAKVIAYLYQHFETQVMDVVADEIEKKIKVKLGIGVPRAVADLPAEVADEAPAEAPKAANA